MHLNFHFFSLIRADLTLAVLICVIAHGFIPAYDANAIPVWFKVGTYAEYRFETGNIIFLNQTLLYIGHDEGEAFFRWECIGLNGNMADVNVTIVFRKEGFYLRLSTQVLIDVESRQVSFVNGTVIGKTRLWLPSNPKLDDAVILAGLPPDEVVGKVTSVGGGTMKTPQGFQTFFDAYGVGKVLGWTVAPVGSWDLDTGLVIQSCFRGEATLIPFELFDPGAMPALYATNIDLGPKVWWPEIANFIWNLSPLIIFVCIFILVCLRRRKDQSKR